MTDREQAGVANPLAIAGASALVVVAIGAVVLAWATDFAICLQDITCEDRGLKRAQLALAVLDVVPASLVVFAVLRRRPRLKWLAIATFLLSLAVWALLNDAATHGWDDLRLV